MREFREALRIDVRFFRKDPFLFYFKSAKRLIPGERIWQNRWLVQNKKNRYTEKDVWQKG